MAPLPALASYLDGLPAGLGSYPACEVKGTMMRAVLRDEVHRRFAADLPHELAKWVASPPLATQWVPEVHQLALMVAAYDGHFAAAGGEPAFLSWAQRGSAQTLSSPLYRAIFALAGPGLLLAGMSRRWGTLRRGTSLELVDQGAGWAEVEMRTPPRLYDDLLLRARARSFQSAVETAGGKAPSARILAVRETGARFRVEWR